MRYFKHMTNARNDDFVRELLYKFGSDGAWAWFGTIEIIAESLTPKRIQRCGQNVETFVTASPKFFSDQLVIPVQTLKKVYRYISSKKKGRFKETRNEWTVNLPKVLAFMDEWTERVLKDTRESLTSGSGATRVSRAEQSSSRADMLAKQGGGEPSAYPPAFALLAKEFTALTGKGPLNKVREALQVMETVEALAQARGIDRCLTLMRERVEECRNRTGRPPTSLKYFVPIFRDDSAFGNGSKRSGPRRRGEARPIQQILPPPPDPKEGP